MNKLDGGRYGEFLDYILMLISVIKCEIESRAFDCLCMHAYCAKLAVHEIIIMKFYDFVFFGAIKLRYFSIEKPTYFVVLLAATAAAADDAVVLIVYCLLVCNGGAKMISDQVSIKAKPNRVDSMENQFCFEKRTENMREPDQLVTSKLDSDNFGKKRKSVLQMNKIMYTHSGQMRLN